MGGFSAVSWDHFNGRKRTKITISTLFTHQREKKEAPGAIRRGRKE